MKKYRSLFPFLCGAILAFIPPMAWAQSERYLADMADRLVSKQAWGKLGLNTAAYIQDGPAPLRLRIGETEYERGLGHHASGEIVVQLDGKYLLFKSLMGVQWQGGGRGSVVFEVWVDGEKRFDSGRMTDSDPAKSVEAPVTGARQLRLVAGDAGDGISCDMADWVAARLVRDATVPDVRRPTFAFDGKELDMPVEAEGSFALLGRDDNAQVALARRLNLCAMAVRHAGEARVTVPIDEIACPFSATVDVALASGAEAEAWLSLESGPVSRAKVTGQKTRLTVTGDGAHAADKLILGVTGTAAGAAVRSSGLQLLSGGHALEIDLFPPVVTEPPFPTPRDVAVSPLLEHELLEWDWRMQDGIFGGKNSFSAAIETILARGDKLIADLKGNGVTLDSEERAWEAAHAELKGGPLSEERGEDLWRRIHEARRRIAFANPLAKTGPLLFVKQAPGIFSHQLTQCYGRYARPGGGVFVLDQPGETMQVRQLNPGALPPGSYMQPEVSYDATRVIVAFCETDRSPENTILGRKGHYYHLYEMRADGSDARPLTDGAFDDFAPKELPNGQIVFVSTRRGGWHRCGSPGCEVYTLALMNADGSGIHTISFHETQEWDPSVLNDGRVVYTRWDYVDRNAVFYEQLWTVRPDGSAPAAFYGNNTFNPVGVWEARAVPASHRVMATAAPHHGMTAGSVILVDSTQGIDGAGPLTRLTPDVPFPESEALLLPCWRAALGPEPSARTPEMDRWPGQCYKSPYPLSEKYFLAAYSYDSLIGEPKGNAANMFGLYLVDAFGNRELVYRDLSISSVWPMPLRVREAPPATGLAQDEHAAKEGTYFLANVYESNPELEVGTAKRLRIIEVLPKSTSGANNPTVGAANASPGKQVLGTVPVEADGSAYFRAPAGIPLSFQALDDLGQAVQVMRSVTYLQPGERASCVGCHEPRRSAPPAKGSMALATRREPSVIEPGPDGSKPLSYPLLVQHVLDKYCVRCHGGEKPAGPENKPIVLTGAPEGRYTASYNALAERVSYSAWGRGAFPDGNSEPLSKPGFFGAKGSPLMKMLLAGHHDVELTPEDRARLITWMDANGLFYGTFNFADQERQQRGERIAGPDLQ